MDIIGKIDGWLCEIFKNKNYGLEYKKSFEINFNNKPFCLINAFPPSIPPDHPDYLEKAHNKALNSNSIYLVTSNLRDTILWRTPKKGEITSREYRLKTYSTIHQVPTAPNPVINPSIEALLKQRVEEIGDDLKKLSEDGHLYSVDIDASFFVYRLHQAVTKMSPLLKKSLSTQLYLKPQFKKDIYAWAVKQGITNYEEESFLEALSRQIVYRLLGKIIFYESLRRYLKKLPEPDFSSLDPSLILKKLAKCFDKARHIDYQTIFEEEIIDKVPYPEEALSELQSLLDDLHRYNFSYMPQDVIGKVFERLIPYEERHALGQYFTREDLVDFINAFCISSKDDFILDPTCGTGTFLIRGYDHLKYLGERGHKKLLKKLWGIDIARFPAQLATINLYRQKIEDLENFPRIISQDFFEVKDDTVFQFPPPRVNFERNKFIKESIPKFDCIVGNFPYIRQELIEKKVKGYKRFLEKALSKNWLIFYPDAFELKEKNKIKDYLQHNMNISPLIERAKLKLSGQADIYAYLFFHCGHFLKENGRMGIVTSNAWLDVAYGYELQKFFLKNFKIIAIVESRCEPWFEDAAVNTIFTILEKCPNQQERGNHLVKFVKLKKKLKDLIPWDMKFPSKRWQGINKLVEKIESTGKKFYKLEGTKIICTLKRHKTYEDDNFRIRVLRQSELLKEVEKQGKTVKWGKYLRAPEVYFEILEKCKDKFVPLKEVADVVYGNKTGITEFFFFSKKQKVIEDEFLLPVIKSPKESNQIKIDKSILDTKILYCLEDKSKLQGKKVLKYIDEGEKKRTTAGYLYPDVPSVKNRRNWYAIENFKRSPILVGSGLDAQLRFFYNPELVINNDTLINITPRKIPPEILCSILNSSVFLLIMETNGRVNLGDGALTLKVYELAEFLIPQIEEVIFKNFKIIMNKLFIRPIKPIFEEVKMKDRQELDSAVLEVLGLDPKAYLPKIYEGLCELVRERLELPKMRKKVKKTKGKRNIERVKEEVIKEILPMGVKKFPEDLWDINIRRGKFKEIDLPQESIVASGSAIDHRYYGTTADIELKDKNGKFLYKTRNPAEVKYIQYAKVSQNIKVKIPQEPISILKTVTAFERYIRDLKNKFFESFYNRTHDQKLSHSLTQSVLEELKIPEVQNKS